MKVAVPLAQHSKMFGQPASSQTVTSSRSRVRSRSTGSAGPCGPRRAATRACAWRSARPASGSTPARRSRRSSGPLGRHLGAPRSTAATAAGPPKRASSSTPSRSSTSRALTSSPSDAQGGDRLVGDPAGHDRGEGREVDVDVERDPVQRAPAPVGRALGAHARRRRPSLGGRATVGPHAGVAVQAADLAEPAGRGRGRRQRRSTASSRRVTCVAPGRRVVVDGDDGPGHDLAGPVEGDVAAAVGLDDGPRRASRAGRGSARAPCARPACTSAGCSKRSR